MSDAADFERVCSVGDVPPGALRSVTLSDGTRVCVGNRGDSFFAAFDRCPHQKFPLSEGELAADGTVVCSWHGAAYDCTSGQGVRGPKRDGGGRDEPFGRLHLCAVEVRDDDLFVAAPRTSLRPPTPDLRPLPS